MNKDEERNAAIKAAWTKWLAGPPLSMLPDDNLCKPAFSDGFDAGEAFGQANTLDEFVRRVEKTLRCSTPEEAVRVTFALRAVKEEMLKEAKDDE